MFEALPAGGEEDRLANICFDVATEQRIELTEEALKVIKDIADPEC